MKGRNIVKRRENGDDYKDQFQEYLGAEEGEFDEYGSISETETLREGVDYCPPPKGNPPVTKKTLKKELTAPIGTGSIVMDTLIFSRQPRTQLITVQTTPTLIIRPPHYWPYIVSNPSLAIGLTSSTTIFNGTASNGSNTQAVASSPPFTSTGPLGVANFSNLHIHANVTALTAGSQWTIASQTRDPQTGNWATAQLLSWPTGTGNLDATGIFYATPGQFGVVVDFAIQFVQLVGAGGTITCTISITLKEGIGGSSGGLARTIFLGGREVSTITGLPLFEGVNRTVYLGRDVELYAVANTSVPIKVLQM